MSSQEPSLDDMLSDPAPAERRSFFYKAATIVLGALATLPPLVVGTVTFFDPLRRKSTAKRVRVAPLDAIPDDGKPYYFAIKADRIDAWNRYPNERIGAVYLVRQPGEETPAAFSAICPHAGCFIGYTPGDTVFQCPCHTSAFNFNGTRVNGDSEVAPRGMDSLEVELRVPKADAPDGMTDVYVLYQRFQTGKKEQIPVA